MHTLDSLARTMVAPAPSTPRRHRGSPVLAHLIAFACALLPLGVMVEAYWLTA